MARFYKTAQPTFLQDAMFELPAELMANVITKKDEGVDENLKAAEEYRKKLEIQNLNTDDPSVNARLAELDQQVNTFTNAIMEDPLNYRKQLADMNALSREIDFDLNKGILGKAQEQKLWLDKRLEEVAADKNISGTKKNLFKQAVQKQYADQGGLGYQDPNTYNQISDLDEQILADVDTDELINTIATNFKADTTADASSGPDRKGYIWTSKGTVEIRDEEDVADYMRTTLKESGWEDQLRQELRWRQINGEDIDINEEVATRKQKVIDQAKNKLGYRKETESKSVSGDSTWSYKQSQRERQAAVKQGFIIQDKRDYRKMLNANGTRRYSDAQIIKFEDTIRGRMIQLGKKIGVGDLDEFRRKYFVNGSLNNISDELKKVGLTKADVITYSNYQDDNKTLTTPHIPGYDELTEEQKNNNPDIVRKQQAYVNSIVEAANSMNNNDRVKSIIVHENGVPKEQHYKTMAELIQDNDGYVYIPVTGTIKTKDLKKSSSGALIDNDGDPMVDANGKPIKTYAEAERAGLANDVVYETGSLSTYDTSENLMKFDAGNVKENDNFKVKENSMFDNSGEYVFNNRYFKVDRNTGKRVLIETEIVVDKNDLNVKFKN